MAERDDLQRVILALESQRAALGDRLVDAALAPLREKLEATTQAGQAGGEQLRLVTVLFADIANSTQLSQGLAADEVADVTSWAIERLARPIAEYGGQVIRFMGDGFQAVFGLAETRENDARQAVRAGLALLDVARACAAEMVEKYKLTGFAVRVGINTGMVAAGGLAESRDTIMGLPVNLAARLESAAPPGGLLISNHTWQHLRRAFEVEPFPAVSAKGFAEPVPAYRVLAARPRTFRPVTRGVEGVETHMVGRQAELAGLQRVYERMSRDRQPHLVTILGEPGVGKSRLLYEFDQWLAHRPVRPIVFKARASPQMAGIPFSMLRELLAYRFAILSGDDAALALHKLETGIASFVQDDWEMKAHLIGALIGLPVSGSPYLPGVAGGPVQLRACALSYLVDLFAAVAKRAPVVLMLDDIHWADAPALQAITQVLRECPGRQVLAVCLARPSLHDFHPDWPGAEGAFAHVRLQLGPLDPHESRQLLTEILRQMQPLPETCCDQILAAAQGNPYYVEELVQMMMDDRVISKDESTGAWSIDADRLGDLHVPSTLTALLQARLNALPAAEKTTLQQASIVGRVFWDAVLAALRPDGQVPTADLAALARRGLVDPQEPSSLSETEEYRFGHPLMRDVTYETVLARDRRLYHGRAAGWLVRTTLASGRSDEHAALIAIHYDKSDDRPAAAGWYIRAGAHALSQGAPAEACPFYDRALALLPPSDRERRWLALLGRDEALGNLGRTEQRMADDAALVALASEMEDAGRLAEALSRQGYFLGVTGRYAEELAAYEQGLAAARRAGAGCMEALLLGLKAGCEVRLGDLEAASVTAEAALASARESGNDDALARNLHNASVYFTECGDLARAAQLLEEQLEINRRTRDLGGEAIGLSSLGYTYVLLGLYREGIEALGRSLDLAQAIGHRGFAAYGALNLALAHLRVGAPEQALALLDQWQPALLAMNDPFGHTCGETYRAMAWEQLGDLGRALGGYTQAAVTLLDLGNSSYAHDALAGAARCLLKQGLVDQARSQVLAVHNYLTQQGGSGMEMPILAFETCADAYEATGDPAAAESALSAGYRQLMARAEKISAPEWRRSFLEDVPEHQRLIARWQRLQALAEPLCGVSEVHTKGS